MGLLDNVERGIEKAVRGVFSTGSKAQVEPVEIASRLRREVDHKSLTVAAGRTLAPNIFDVQLSDDDFKRAQAWGTPLAEELCDVVINHVRSQGYTLQGSVRISRCRRETPVSSTRMSASDDLPSTMDGAFREYRWPSMSRTG